MKTLNYNYAKNLEILKENLKRGMRNEQVQGVINSQERQFINADQYNQEEKNYINEMRKATIEFFTNLSIHIVKA